MFSSLRDARGIGSLGVVDALIGLGVSIGHKVFGMVRDLNERGMELFAGHFALVVKDLGAGFK